MDEYNTMNRSWDLPIYTAKDIAAQNKASKRRTCVLAPIKNRVYDFKKIHELIKPIIKDMNTEYEVNDEQLPKRLVTTDFWLQQVADKRSPYLGIIGMCAYWKVPAERMDEVKNASLKGYLKSDYTLKEQQSEFRNNVQLVLESSVKGDAFLDIYYENCQRMMEDYTYFTFEDKLSKEMLGYQDNHVPFPLPCWRQKIDMRDHLYSITRYYKRMSAKKNEVSIEEQQKYIRTNVSETIDSMQETLEKHINIMSDNDIQNKQLSSVASVNDYLSNYCRTFIKSCESYRSKQCTKIARSKTLNGWNNLALINSYIKDVNQLEFPLPGYSKIKDMRVFLKDYTPFDCQMPQKECKDDDDDDEYIFKGTISESEVHEYFLNSVASNRDVFMDTDIDNGAVVWEEMQLDVIKKDILTEKQEELLKSREKRTDLHDERRKNRRRSTLIKYFMNKYDMDDILLKPFQDWAVIVSDSIQLFSDLCEGKITPVAREVFSKVELAEKRYQELMLNVPVISESEKERMKLVRNRLLMDLTKKCQRYKEVSEEEIMIFRDWAVRLEENNQALQELCNSNPYSLETRSNPGLGNAHAVFHTEVNN